MSKRVELFEFLYRECLDDADLLSVILDRYVNSLNDDELTEFEDFLVNNFGDN